MAYTIEVGQIKLPATVKLISTRLSEDNFDNVPRTSRLD